MAYAVGFGTRSARRPPAKQPATMATPPPRPRTVETTSADAWNSCAIAPKRNIAAPVPIGRIARISAIRPARVVITSTSSRQASRTRAPTDASASARGGSSRPMSASVQAARIAASPSPPTHGAGAWTISHSAIPPPAVWPNWLPDWNQPAARPRVAGVVLWAISPSVANALKVADTVVNSVSAERSGAVAFVSGTAVIARRPTAIAAMAIRYQVLRESV